MRHESQPGKQWRDIEFVLRRASAEEDRRWLAIDPGIRAIFIAGSRKLKRTLFVPGCRYSDKSWMLHRQEEAYQGAESMDDVSPKPLIPRKIKGVFIEFDGWEVA